MKHHLFLWSIALIAVLLASVVYMSRQTRAQAGFLSENPEAVIARALDLLETDVNAIRPDTQNAIRAGAVVAEEGLVTSAEGAFILGRQYERERNFQRAEGLFKKAIALHPDWSLPYTSLASLLGLHSFGRVDEAKEALRKAIELDPEFGRPYGILGIILRAEGRFEEALEPAQMALKYMPNDISSLNNYANLLLDMKRYEEAEDYFRRAIGKFPEHPTPYYNLACLYALVGKREQALENLQEAFQRTDALRYEALNDADLASLHDDPEFLRLVHRGSIPAESSPPEA